ncbi:MAG: hypothetical protein GY893_09145 [bacterium]|nr:hypothetical protein [bacterium]
MSLFRKKALDSLNTPEQLDQPMQLLRSSHWALLIGLLSFSGYLVLWSVFGRIPVRIQGNGVLTTPNTMHLTQAETFGRVKSMQVEPGKCFVKGETLAVIEPVQLQLEQEKGEDILKQLIADDATEHRHANQRLKLKQRELKRWQEAASGGAISIIDLELREQEMKALEGQIDVEDNRRNQNIHQQRVMLAKIKQEISKTATIKAAEDGCIIGRHVQIGQLVQPATTLFEFNAANDSHKLQSLGFFAAKDGKRLKLGQPVRVTPTTTKPQRHGGIQGVITDVRPLPISQAALTLRLGNDATVNSINQRGLPLIEVSTSLKRDDNTISGYDWGGGNGPDLQLSPGTTTNVSVIVEERAPISYVIPLLRDLSGVY